MHNPPSSRIIRVAEKYRRRQRPQNLPQLFASLYLGSPEDIDQLLGLISYFVDLAPKFDPVGMLVSWGFRPQSES